MANFNFTPDLVEDANLAAYVGAPGYTTKSGEELVHQARVEDQERQERVAAQMDREEEEVRHKVQRRARANLSPKLAAYVANVGVEVSPELAEELARREARELAERILDGHKRAQVTGGSGEAKDNLPALFTSLEDLANNAEVTDPAPVIDGWLLEGQQALVYSRAKVGKSYFAHYLIECLLTGHRFLDTYTTTRVGGAVGLMDLELPLSYLRSRLVKYDRLGGAERSRLKLYPLREVRQPEHRLDLMDADSVEWWVSRWREDGLEVVVIDPLSTLLRMSNMDQNDQAGYALNVLQAMAVRAGLKAMVVITHASSKGGGLDNGPRGDSAQLDAPDSVWRLTPASDVGKKAPAEVDILVDTMGRNQSFENVPVNWVDGKGLDNYHGGSDLFRFKVAPHDTTQPTALAALAVALRPAVVQTLEDGEKTGEPYTNLAMLKRAVVAVANASSAYPDVNRPKVGEVLDLFLHRQVLTKANKSAPYEHHAEVELDASLAFAKAYGAEKPSS